MIAKKHDENTDDGKCDKDYETYENDNGHDDENDEDYDGDVAGAICAACRGG